MTAALLHDHERGCDNTTNAMLASICAQHTVPAHTM